jgi:hypothetical protein
LKTAEARAGVVFGGHRPLPVFRFGSNTGARGRRKHLILSARLLRLWVVFMTGSDE